MKHRKTIAEVLDKQALKRMLLSKLVTHENGCHVWSGSVGFSGYGQVSVEGRTWSAHRLAYEIANGPIAQDAPKWWVLHKCDNPACCNPDHLYLGDAKDNANDMIDRKRQRMGFKRHGGGENIRFGRVFYEIGGEIKTLHEWAEQLNVNSSTLDQRLAAGWPEKSLGLPSKVYKRHSKGESQTKYRRFSGLKEVEEYKRKASVAATTEALLSTNRDGNIDMTSIAILEAVNTSSVQFYGQPIITAMVAGVAYVAMRPIVENIGIDWTGQLVKLRNQKEKFGCRDISTPSKGGIQKMLCIPLRKLNGWLFSINPAKVRADIRDKLIAYQEECFTVLHDYWTKGAAARNTETTVDDRTPLRGIVNRIMGKYGMTYQAVYKLVHKEFGVRHIDELSPKQTSEAIEYLAAKAIEGEFLGKQLELTAPKLDISIPIEWWIENNAAVRWGNHENLEKREQDLRFYTPK